MTEALPALIQSPKQLGERLAEERMALNRFRLQLLLPIVIDSVGSGTLECSGGIGGVGRSGLDFTRPKGSTETFFSLPRI